MRDDHTGLPSIGDRQLGINGLALLSPLTGIGQYTWNLVTELRQLLRHPPWLFYATDWRNEIRSAPMAGASGFKQIAKRLIPGSYRVARLLMQRRFNAGVRTHRIALYHEPNYLAFDYRGPTIVTVHDLSWVRYPQTHPAERVRRMNRLMPDIVRRADHIVVDSMFIRAEVMAHYGVAPERVSTVLLGVQPDFRPRDEAACQTVLLRHGLRYGAYLLAVGTLEPRKNLQTVLAAFAQLPATLRRRYPLVIVGGAGWRMEAFSASVRQMIARAQVILTGFVSQADLPMLYAAARMLVYPSLYEGFGLPPLEAMACGVPVICADRASLPEVVGNAGILIDALDDRVLAAQIERLIEDESLHQALSESGVQRARQFTWRRCALQTLNVYQSVLQDS